MDPAGQRLGTKRINNDPMVLAAQIAEAGEHPQVVLEATYGWYWAADVLIDAGAQVHLAHPLGVKGFAYRRVKNDVRDAADLADLLRMGRLPEAWVAPPPVRELRELVRHRAKLVAWRSGLKASVHAVLAKQGLHPHATDLFGVGGRQWLTVAPLDAAFRMRVNALLRLIDAIDFEITAVAGPLRVALADHVGFRAVQKVPGVGPVLAAVFVAEIGDVTRFASPAHLASWAGLTPKHHESDTVVRRGPITNKAPPWCDGPRSKPPRAPATLTGSPRPAPASANDAAVTSPPSRWPASCSPTSTTACATDTSAPSSRPRRREQART
jgi:transposase